MKVIISIIFLTSVLFSQTILCYKKNLPTQNLYKDIELSGSNCNGKSLNELLKNGWKLNESKVVKNKLNIFDHIYILSKQIDFKTIKPKELTRIVFNNKPIKAYITSIQNSSATIPLKNIQVGQTGIIIHKTKQNHMIIVGSGVVTKSNNINSTIQLLPAYLLNQPAIPTTKLKPQKHDIFILRHLYNTSLLIVPNLDAKQAVKNIYKKQNFLSEDFFATYLKIHQNPVPSKKDIQQFCKENQIGTIFIVVKKQLYILDAMTFNLLDTQYLDINNSKTNVPFFTNIKDIKKGFWDFLDRSKIEDYNSYYKAMISNEVYIPKNISNEEISIFDKIKDLWPW